MQIKTIVTLCLAAGMGKQATKFISKTDNITTILAKIKRYHNVQLKIREGSEEKKRSSVINPALNGGASNIYVTVSKSNDMGTHV